MLFRSQSFVCDTKIPIGEAVDRTSDLLNDMYKELETIYRTIPGQIDSAEQMIAGAKDCDLDHCKPLKVMILRPEENGILGVETNLMDNKGTIGIAGLFIPEQWSMPPYIDDYGNSDVETALKEIKKERVLWKAQLDGEQYQLRVSQKPIDIAEAFAYRKESIFPQAYVSRQLKRIEDKEYSYEHLELERDHGVIKASTSNKLPINEFPVNKKREDKTGVLVVWERPIKDPGFGKIGRAHV